MHNYQFSATATLYKEHVTKQKETHIVRKVYHTLIKKKKNGKD